MMNLPNDQTCDILSVAFRYPSPGLCESLRAGAEAIQDETAARRFSAFLEGVGGLSLGAWEELYTRTLDLNPLAAPYLGYQLWGDGYARGAFMATLNRAYRSAGLDSQGELPDHLAPVLRFLASGAPVPPELASAFSPALEKMSAALRQADPSNPYLDLLEAVASIVRLSITETRPMEVV